MNKELKIEVENWLNAHPESEHSFDRERWYLLILKSRKLGIYLDFDEINHYLIENKQWDFNYRLKFIEDKRRDYSKLMDFLDFYQTL